jgi:6-phosphogluconolactonase (cycloisomerase 2 family)
MRLPIAKVVVELVVVVMLTAPAARAASLTPLAVYFNGQGGVEGLDETVAGALSPDGADLYTGGQKAVVAHFRRDPSTGLLRFVEALRNGRAGVQGLDGTQGITVSPDGLNVYTASIDDTAISVFRRDPATGRLSFVEAEEDFGSIFLSQPEKVAVSPDGAFVYATIFQGSVAVYRRDPATGALTFSSRHGDDQGPADRLVGAEGLAISGDGSYVYVACSFDDTVAVFRRSAGDGTLSLIQTVFDDAAGGQALAGADALALSPNGRHLYVGTTQDPAITVFDRNPVSGRLALSAVYSNGSGGVSGLWGVTSLTVSPNGAFLYAASIFDSRLAVFQRDPQTGALTFLEASLPGAFSLASSTNGEHLYAVSFSFIQAYRTSGAGGCQPRADALCLRNGRFRVEASWADGNGGSGPGQAVSLTDETGYFWFFDRDNVEVVTKLLDACNAFGRFWFFAAGLTNVGVQLTVTDLATGEVRIYTNPEGRPFPPMQDTSAFSGCP